MEKELMESEKLIIQALVYGIIFLGLLTTGLILFFHYSRKKIVQKELEKASMKLENQQKILQTSIAIQEAERKRISQDLHDAISSKLNIISLTTNVLLADTSFSNKQKQALEQVLDITAKTLESSRKIAHDLMPPILDKFGLKVALEELFDEISAYSIIDIEHDIDELVRLTNTNQLHVFRIIQELISNSIKHSNANEIVVFIEEKPKGFLLHYQDNGSGFQTKEVSKKSGIGLQNIYSRVKILNGSIKIESSKNKGSHFIIKCTYHE